MESVLRRRRTVLTWLQNNAQSKIQKTHSNENGGFGDFNMFL